MVRTTFDFVLVAVLAGVALGIWTVNFLQLLALVA